MIGAQTATISSATRLHVARRCRVRVLQSASHRFVALDLHVTGPSRRDSVRSLPNARPTDEGINALIESRTARGRSATLSRPSIRRQRSAAISLDRAGSEFTYDALNFADARPTFERFGMRSPLRAVPSRRRPRSNASEALERVHAIHRGE